MLNFSPLPAGICGQDTPRTKDCRFRPIVLCAWIQKSPGFAGPSTCRCGAAEPSLFQPTYATFAQYSYLTHQRENISYPCPQQTGACFYRSNSSPKHACPCVALLPWLQEPVFAVLDKESWSIFCWKQNGENSACSRTPDTSVIHLSSFLHTSMAMYGRSAFCTMPVQNTLHATGGRRSLAPALQRWWSACNSGTLPAKTYWILQVTLSLAGLGFASPRYVWSVWSFTLLFVNVPRACDPNPKRCELDQGRDLLHIGHLLGGVQSPNRCPSLRFRSSWHWVSLQTCRYMVLGCSRYQASP